MLVEYKAKGVVSVMRQFWERPVTRRRLADWFILPLWWLLDRLTGKRFDVWAFFVHPVKNDQFVENARAVFEQVKTDENITKLVFTRGPVQLDLEGACNTKLVELQSLAGIYALSRCGVYLLTNTIAMDLSWRWSDNLFSLVRPTFSRRIIVNLWHGIPLKRLFALANTESRLHADRAGFRRKERAYYHGLVASSDIDSYAMAAIFHPIPYGHVWVNGLPRNDFLVRPESDLPVFLRHELQQLRAIKAGRRLVTYAPTFRERHVQGSAYYQFTDAHIQRLKALLARHDAVLGFRMHYFRKGEQLFNLEQYIDNDRIFDLGHSQIKEIAPVLRQTDVLVTDYSSVYIDALYLNKPVISFAYDLEHYSAQQNGLLYEMDLAFPGPVVRQFDQLLEALDSELARDAQSDSERYQMTRRLFFKYTDDKNSARLVERINALIVERNG